MPAKGHTPAKIKFWSGHIEKWKSSGLSLTEYCAQQGIAKKSFWRWKRILAKGSSSSPPTIVTGEKRPLISLAVLPDSPATHLSEQPNHAGIRLHLDGYAIDLAVGFHAATLQTLLKTLAGAR